MDFPSSLNCLQQIGKLTPEERLQKILRYRAKRQMRNFNRTIKYQCRKSLADTRPRVRGRFARDNEPGSVMPHETKKAMRATDKISGGGGKTSSGGGGGGGGSSGSAADQDEALRAGSASPVLMKAEPIQAGTEMTGPNMMMDQPFGSGRSGMQYLAPPQRHQQGQGGGQESALVLEQQASLAQLYNQWSETGVTSSSGQQGQDPAILAAGKQQGGASSNSA